MASATIEKFAYPATLLFDHPHWLVLVRYDKLNYLMPMMVDPHVHFHIIPRYRGTRSFAGLALADHGWPCPPDVKSAVELESAAIQQAVDQLQGAVTGTTG